MTLGDTQGVMWMELWKGWDLDFCYSVTLGDTQGYADGTL
jgi:hypothetical protein